MPCQDSVSCRPGGELPTIKKSTQRSRRAHNDYRAAEERQREPQHQSKSFTKHQGWKYYCGKHRIRVVKPETLKLSRMLLIGLDLLWQFLSDSSVLRLHEPYASCTSQKLASVCSFKFVIQWTEIRCMCQSIVHYISCISL